MSVLPLASVVVIGLAAGAGLGLMVVMFWRLAARHERLQRDVERMQRVLKDGSRDVRARLEESTRAVAAVHTEVRPLMETFGSDVETIRSRLEEQGPMLESLGAGLRGFQERLDLVEARLEQAEGKSSDASAEVAALREEAARLEELIERGEGLIGGLGDGRAKGSRELDALQEVVTDLRGAVDEQIAFQEERIDRLEVGTTEPTEDTRGARWIFLVLALLLGVALVAQYVRTH